MTSGGPPDALNDRHRLLATYIALGYTNEEAGRELDLAPNRISIIRQSPLFAHEVEQERRRIRTQITADALGLLHQEALPSVRRLAELRDQSDNLNVALGASNSIVDRVVPKTLRHEEERTLRIVFDAEVLAEMREALVEDGAFVEVEEALALPDPEGVHRADPGPRLESLDDVLAALRADEALAEPA